MRLIDIEEVEQRVDKKRGWIYGRIKAGQFPLPKKIGRNSKWVDTDIDQWIEDLPRAIARHGVEAGQ